MNTTTTFRLALTLCAMGVSLPALAVDVRPQLTPELIYSHCQTAGIGSQTEGTFMLPSGRVTGSVLCTADDLVASKAAPSRYGDDDDGENDDDGRRHSERDDDDHDREGDDD